MSDDKATVHLKITGGSKSITEEEAREAIALLWAAVGAVDPSTDLADPGITFRWQCDVCGAFTTDKDGWAWDDRGDVCPSCQDSGEGATTSAAPCPRYGAPCPHEGLCERKCAYGYRYR